MQMMVGVDLAKSVFQLHGATMTGEVLFRKKLTRPQFLRFMTDLEPAVVVMEACGGAHYWVRTLNALGHEAKMISPQYVRPFVKRQKNDAADAEAIVVAAQRPEMRFVAPKSEEQQACAAVFRSRERLVRYRTMLMNALRGLLYENGHCFPQGVAMIGRIRALLKTPDNGINPLVQEECHDLLEQIDETSARIEAKTEKVTRLAAQSDTARRLRTIPGVGPITALSIAAFVPRIEDFRSGRDFAAWIGLVPRQFSSGGKIRMGRISKAGQRDIRRLLIMGAMSRLTTPSRHKIAPESWLGKMLARKPRLLVSVALANKMARTIWALLTKGEDYRAQGA